MHRRSARRPHETPRLGRRRYRRGTACLVPSRWRSACRPMRRHRRTHRHRPAPRAPTRLPCPRFPALGLPARGRPVTGCASVRGCPRTGRAAPHRRFAACPGWGFGSEGSGGRADHAFLTGHQVTRTLVRRRGRSAGHRAAVAAVERGAVQSEAVQLGGVQRRWRVLMGEWASWALRLGSPGGRAPVLSAHATRGRLRRARGRRNVSVESRTPPEAIAGLHLRGQASPSVPPGRRADSARSPGTRAPGR